MKKFVLPFVIVLFSVTLFMAFSPKIATEDKPVDHLIMSVQPTIKAKYIDIYKNGSEQRIDLPADSKASRAAIMQTIIDLGHKGWELKTFDGGMYIFVKQTK